MLHQVSKVSFGGNPVKMAQNVVKVTGEVAKNPQVQQATAGAGIMVLTAGQAAFGTAVAILTSPVTLTVAGTIAAGVGTAYLVEKLCEEDDD